MRGFEKLGWHWWPSDNAILSRDYAGRTGCDNRGRCNFGCPLRAKASTDVTYWPRALAAGAVLRTWARVKEISVAGDGRVDGVVYFDRKGTEHKQHAKVVVVCGNGIGTPRLLLASRSRLFPDGLANGAGNVGRNLMNHPSRGVEGIFAEPFETESFTGNPFFSQQFYETDRGRGFVRGYSLMVYRPFGPTSVAWGDSAPVPWGASHHREMRRRFGHTVSVAVMAEDLPEDVNRVELDPAVKDGNGIPAPRATYRLSENTRKMLAHGAAAARQVLEAAGAIEVHGQRTRRQLRALHGDGAHGERPAHVGGERLEPGARGAEPVRGGRQLVHDQRGGEPHLDHRRAGPARRRRDLGAAPGVLKWPFRPPGDTVQPPPRVLPHPPPITDLRGRLP